MVGDWDVNKVVNYPIHNGDSGLRSKNTGTGTAAHFLTPLCVVPMPHFEYSMMGHFVIAAGAQRKLCWRKAQVLAFFAAWWTC